MPFRVVMVFLIGIRELVTNGLYTATFSNLRAINRPLSKPSRRVYKGFAPICARLAQRVALPPDIGLPALLLPTEVYPHPAQARVSPDTSTNLARTNPASRLATNGPALGPLFLPRSAVYTAANAFLGFTPSSTAVEYRRF